MRVKKSGVVIAALFIAAALVAGAACRSKSAEEKIVENRLESALEKASGGKVDIDLKGGTLKVKTADGESVLTTGEQKWPEDLPAGMIKFEGAEVSSVARTGDEERKVWSVHLTDFGEGVFERFAEKLKAEGWTIDSSMAFDNGGGSIAATKDDLQISAMISVEDKTGIVTYTLRLDK